MDVMTLLDAYQEQAMASYQLSVEYYTEGAEKVNKVLTAFNNFVGNVFSLIERYFQLRKVRKLRTELTQIFKDAVDRNNQAILNGTFKVSMIVDRNMVDTDLTYTTKVFSGLVKAFQSSIDDEQFHQVYNKYLYTIVKRYEKNMQTQGWNVSFQNAINLLGALDKSLVLSIESYKDGFRHLTKPRKDNRGTDYLFRLLRVAMTDIKLLAMRTIYTVEGLLVNFKKKIVNEIDTTGQKYFNDWVKEKGRYAYQDVAKASTYRTSYTFGKQVFQVYELPFNIHSAFINRDNKIYVDKEFFTYPVCMQKAILYHEIGHFIQGHFDPRQRIWSEKEIKELERNFRSYREKVKKTDLVPSEDVMASILIEADADRFASKIVGKRTYRKSTDVHMNRVLDSEFLMRSGQVEGTLPEEKERIKRVNKELQKLRLELV